MVRHYIFQFPLFAALSDCHFHHFEILKFLPILTELIVWGATDENVDELVEKIVKSAD